jgi:hypothetical protein
VSSGPIELTDESGSIRFKGRAKPPPGGGSMPFDPTQITGLKLWLDASDEATINAGSPSDGDPVSVWKDKSGQGNDAAQATGGQQPTYQAAASVGFAGLLFDGVDDLLVAAGPTVAAPLTMAIVCGLSSGTVVGMGAVVAACNADPAVGSSVGPYFEVNPGVPGNWSPSGTLGFPVPDPRVLGNSAYDVLVISMDDDNVADGSLNRTARGKESDIPYGLTGVALGLDPATPVVTGSQPWPGAITEVVVYDRALTADERLQLIGYLEAKSGTF